MSAAQRALEARLAEIMPLFQEARDALTAIYPAAARLHGVDLSLADRMDAVGTKDWRAALEAEIAQEVEPVEVQMRVGKRGSWRKPYGGPERAYQLMRDNPGVYELRELFTAPTVNAELLEALKDLMRWQVQNVSTWHNSAYDQAARIVAKVEGAKP